MLYMLEGLDLDRGDVMPMYLGDDMSDEHASKALAGRGVGIFVGSVEDPEVAGRTTAADYVLHTIEEVEQFLDTLAR
jgi:trehalose 6-phosphate phosphatase